MLGIPLGAFLDDSRCKVARGLLVTQHLMKNDESVLGVDLSNQASRSVPAKVPSAVDNLARTVRQRDRMESLRELGVDARALRDPERDLELLLPEDRVWVHAPGPFQPLLTLVRVGRLLRVRTVMDPYRRHAEIILRRVKALHTHRMYIRSEGRGRER